MQIQFNLSISGRKNIHLLSLNVYIRYVPYFTYTVQISLKGNDFVKGKAIYGIKESVICI